MDNTFANSQGYMTNSQAQAYAEYTLCKFVEDGHITSELMGDILREMCWFFDILTLREVEVRAQKRRSELCQEVATDA